VTDLFGDGVSQSLKKSKITIGYLFLMVFVLIGFMLNARVVGDLQEVVDEQARITREFAMSNCQSGNETRDIIENILLSLAAPRPNDEPGDQERRQESLDSLLPFLERRDCQEFTKEAAT
jgi:hypothetical protein